MSLRSRCAALLAVWALVVIGVLGVNPVRAQTPPIDPTLLVLRAKAKADVIHGWHTPPGHLPSREEYCRQYRDAENILDQLQSLLDSGAPGGPSRKTIRDAGNQLDDELAEEDAINDFFGFDPCPPPIPLLRFGGYGGDYYVGVQFLANWGKLGIVETDRTSGLITNQFNERGKRDGFGLQFGANYAPWSAYPTLRVGPYASFDVFDQTIRHSFPSTTYLGTTSNWSASVGVKFGTMVTPKAFLYTLGGATFLNEKVEINFGGPITSTTKTIPGLTLGFGAEYKPDFLQGFGAPVSVFAQYQHTWYQDAHLDAPAASPTFNYKFTRSDDMLKLGANIHFPVQ